MAELFSVMTTSVWHFIGCLILIAVIGRYFIYYPMFWLTRIFAIHCLKDMNAKREIAVMAGLKYTDKDKSEKG